MTLANLNQIDENFPQAESAERRIEKLTKINRALMRRVERAMEQPNAASLYGGDHHRQQDPRRKDGDQRL